MHAMLYTQTGRQIHEYWDSPYRNAWTKFMSRGRYVQLTSVLHVNDNSDEERRTQDSLHKIRPLLNGKYATFGNKMSYNEATMVNK